MKQLLLSILIIHSINCFAQEPNPDLFQSWFLYSVMASDGTPEPYVVSEMEIGTITPSLTIREDLSFYGQGICNLFDGKFNLSNPDVLETDQFSNTTIDCGIHNSFENEYFNFIELAGGYTITSETNGLVLTINTPVFGQAIFKNFGLLNTLSFDLKKITIYPNPSNSIIYIKPKNIPITKIEIYNSLGQSIKTIENKFDIIDITNFSNGFYIMKIYSKLGSLNKRIIKK